MLTLVVGALSFSVGPAATPAYASRNAAVSMAVATKPVVIGVAADSGCGKSTFMRRMTSIFGGESKLLDIGRETNTLVSDMTTVICLDDYHKWDRTGRKSNPEWPDGITALHADCQKWDKMAEDVTNLKSGKRLTPSALALPLLSLPGGEEVVPLRSWRPALSSFPVTNALPLSRLSCRRQVGREADLQPHHWRA